MNEIIDTRGYGPEVKQLANELKQMGVGTLDLPASDDYGPGSPFERFRSRAFGYRRSLTKIFGHEVRVYVHNPDPESGDRFIAFSFE